VGLKNIHVVFISCAIALGLAVGSWAISMYRDLGGAGYLVFGALSFVVAIALAAYGTWFVKKTKDLSS
jgi:hypothetical protein